MLLAETLDELDRRSSFLPSFWKDKISFCLEDKLPLHRAVLFLPPKVTLRVNKHHYWEILDETNLEQEEARVVIADWDRLCEQVMVEVRPKWLAAGPIQNLSLSVKEDTDWIDWHKPASSLRLYINSYGRFDFSVWNLTTRSQYLNSN